MANLTPKKEVEKEIEQPAQIATVTIQESLYLKIIDVLDGRDSKEMRGLANQLEYILAQAKHGK